MTKMFFTVKAETKGAIRFQQVKEDGSLFTIADGAEIGDVYVRKSAFPNGTPSKIVLTMEVVG